MGRDRTLLFRVTEEEHEKILQAMEACEDAESKKDVSKFIRSRVLAPEQRMDNRKFVRREIQKIRTELHHALMAMERGEAGRREAQELKKLSAAIEKISDEMRKEG